jgi:hypothetical protein
VTELQDKLTKDGPTMTDTAKNTLMREIEKEKKVYELEQQNAQSSLDDDRKNSFAR